MTIPAISVARLTVRYGDVTALADINVQVRPGAICALIGVNGSGKSTLLKAIAGVVKPQTGSILVRGETVAQARRAGAVGYVPQDDAIDRDFPIRVDEVVMAGRYGGMGPTRRPSNGDLKAVADALRRVDLVDAATRRIGQLSGGQRRRVLVARAIAQDASVLLLDEPFAGVDEGSTAILSSVLREMATHGTTVLISTHDLAAVPALADDAILLMNRVVIQGDPGEVIRPTSLAGVFDAASSMYEPPP